MYIQCPTKLAKRFLKLHILIIFKISRIPWGWTLINLFLGAVKAYCFTSFVTNVQQRRGNHTNVSHMYYNTFKREAWCERITVMAYPLPRITHIMCQGSYRYFHATQRNAMRHDATRREATLSLCFFFAVWRSRSSSLSLCGENVVKTTVIRCPRSRLTGFIILGSKKSEETAFFLRMRELLFFSSSFLSSASDWINGVN